MLDYLEPILEFIESVSSGALGGVIGTLMMFRFEQERLAKIERDKKKYFC